MSVHSLTRNAPSLKKKFQYVHACTSSTCKDIDAMTEQSRKITLRTFRESIGLRAWKVLVNSLGYTHQIPISRDRYIGYYKSVYRGVPAVYVEHSRIEYIYTLHGKLEPRTRI